MNKSLRGTAVALAACAAPVLAAVSANSAQAAPLSPHQQEALQQSVGRMQVPFGIPLGTLVQHVTGKHSDSGVQGSIPAMPLEPPTAGRDTHALIPDPLVPSLNSASRTPELGVIAPMPSADGTVHDGGTRLAVPAAPLKAVSSALGLGHPVTYQGRAMAAPASQELPQLDLTRLQPSVTPPTLQSAPGGQLSFDQRTPDANLIKPVQDVVASAKGALDAARG
ncbi:hypothetical protein ABIA32_006715 [Streptacidiphilus sp. MAP12-20]|uniref:hypothetical protein n=1 Tax=Streptacidiphilus sp. MAP12-20 TaxID=3156299 RepID=UPI003510F1B6